MLINELALEMEMRKSFFSNFLAHQGGCQKGTAVLVKFCFYKIHVSSALKFHVLQLTFQVYR